MPRKKSFEPATRVKASAKIESKWDKEVVDSGVVDWVAVDDAGREFYGSTQAEAEKLRADYHK